MDTPLTIAIISAAAAIVVRAISFYLTKSKERQADWQRYKFELYKELVQSLSGIVDGLNPGGKQAFRVRLQYASPDRLKRCYRSLAPFSG